MSKDKFPCMLAQANKFLDRITFPAIAQTKMDGLRANIVIDRGVTTVYSRNGKEITTFDHFDGMTQYDNVVLDGELLVLPPKGFELVHKERTLKFDGKTPMDRQTGNGIVNKSIVSDKRRTTITKDEASMFKIVLWDMIDIKGWEKGHDPKPYNNRFEKLQTMDDDHRFDLVESQVVNDLDSAMKLFKKKLKEGQEGLILKNHDMPWENKRSYHMVKMKDVKEIDLLCTEWVPGLGKNEGILGALKCQNKDGTIEVNVGSGFNDEHRNSLKPKDVVGKIIAVKYNDLIKSRDNKPTSLFLPIFVEVRQDKTEAD